MGYTSDNQRKTENTISTEGRNMNSETNFVPYDDVTHEELCDFLSDYVTNENFREIEKKIGQKNIKNIDGLVGHLLEISDTNLKKVFEKLNLIDTLSKYVSLKREEKRKTIEEGWKKISTPEIDNYISNPNSLLNLKTLILFARIMDEDIMDDCGISFTDDTDDLLNMIDPVFHGKRKDSGLTSYYDFINLQMVDDLVYHDRVDKKELFDTYELVKKLSKTTWKHNYSSPSVQIYFGDSVLDILVIFTDEKGALFLQHDSKFVYVGRTCHYSCLRTNTYHETDDNTFVNGYRTEYCGLDSQTAFETFIGMSAPQGVENGDKNEAEIGRADQELYKEEDLVVLESELSKMKQESIWDKLYDACCECRSIATIETILKYYKGNLKSIIECVVRHERLDILELLDKYGAKLEPINSLLGIAAENDSTKMIEYLVKHGADVNYQDGHRGTPLYKTIPYRRESAKLLIKLGADVNGGSIGIFRGFDSCVNKAKREMWSGNMLDILSKR